MSSRESSTNIKRGDMFLNNSFAGSYYINIIISSSHYSTPHEAEVFTIFAMEYDKTGKLKRQRFELCNRYYLKKTMTKI